MTAFASDPIALAVFALLSAALIVGMIDLLRRRTGAENIARPDDLGAAFLFHGVSLIDATPVARQLLHIADNPAADIRATTDLLTPRFAGLADCLRSPDATLSRVIPGTAAGESLKVERWDGFTRLTLSDDGLRDTAQRMQVTALETELAALRAIAEDAPQLIWKQESDGTVIWANRSYLALADELTQSSGDATRHWPVRPVFTLAINGDDECAARTRRIALSARGSGELRWFEVTTVRRGQHQIGFAVDATGAVAAEDARKTFVQTLTKTFASLKAGLAIFDRKRRLVLFNPAFTDLTGLRPEFLTARPLVHTVLDRLRDIQMLPEPKNYASWRDQVAALEAAAEQGTYCETWVLPAGQTYRVSGSPHPDGAIAFLFEDISDEVSLTRHFRLEQETAQAVLDIMPQAMAVFSVAGTMVLCNQAYEQLWGLRDHGLRDTSAIEEIARWQAQSAPSPLWEDIATRCGAAKGRNPAQFVITLADGRAMEARFSPLPGGAMLAEFHNSLPDVKPVPVPSEGDGWIADQPPESMLRDTGT